MVRGILTNYRLLKITRIEELGFLYLMLKKDHWLNFKDFVAFLNLFKADSATKIAIAKKLLEFCDLKNRDQKIGISENMFAKFLISAEQLTLSFLEQTLQDKISQYFKDRDHFDDIMIEMFQYSQDSKEKHLRSRDESILALNVPAIAKATSAPEISDSSEQQSIISEQQVMQVKGEKIAPYLRKYSPLSFQLCSYLENKEETKFLGVRQRVFIRHYLVMHVLENEMDQTVGLVDYFSDEMLGLVCSQAPEYTIERLGSP